MSPASETADTNPLDGHCGETAAWIVAPGNLVIRAFSGQFSGPEKQPWDSAVTRLIAGVSQEFGEESYRFLRQRIFVTGEISEWDRNLVKVCAKRMSPAIQAPQTNPGKPPVDLGRPLQIDTSSCRRRDLPGSRLAEAEIIQLTEDLVAAEEASCGAVKRHQAPRCVAAVLASSDGQILAINVNTNAFEKFRHAEVNLLMAMVASGIPRIPDGSTLYVSLKPCRMCASLIRAMQGPGERLRVVALNDDPGPQARHQMLPGLIFRSGRGESVVV